MTSHGRRYPLSRQHHIPLRRQLAADLEAGIRDGKIAPGSKFPSSRDLARHLDVDRGTVQAALARLRRRGLLQTNVGRRSEVPARRRPSPRQVSEAIVEEQQARALALDIAASGLRSAYWSRLPRDVFLDELRDVLAGAEGEEGPPEALLFEPCEGLRAALAAEIRACCGIEVFSLLRFRDAPESTPILLRDELFVRLRRPEGREFLPLSLSGGTREREIVRRKVRSGLVVLLSGSAALREYASELAAREFERGVSFAAIDPRDAGAAVRAVAAARLVFCDRSGAGFVPPSTAPVIPIQFIDPDDLAALKRYLGSGPSQFRLNDVWSLPAA